MMPTSSRAVLSVLLLALALLCPQAFSASLVCNSTSPSSLNSIGCELSSFPALAYSFSVTVDSTAQPTIVLVLGATTSSSSSLSAYFLNGTFYKTLGTYTSPKTVTLDSRGYVFLTDTLTGVVAFAPYPSYAFLSLAIQQPYLTSGASVTTPGGEYLLYTQSSSLYVYLLAFNATGAYGTRVAIVNPPSFTSTSYSVAVQPTTGQVCVYDNTNAALTLYTPNYSNASAPTFTATASFTTANSALSVLVTSATTRLRSALSAVTSNGAFLITAEGADKGTGFPVLSLWLAPNGASALPTTGPALLLSPTVFPESFYYTQTPPFPVVGASSDGSLVVVPNPSGGGVYLLQGVTGADPASSSTLFPVYTDLNSSFTVTAALQSPILYGAASQSITATGYSTAVPGSMTFAVEVVSSGPSDLAYVTFVGTLPQGLVLSLLSPAGSLGMGCQNKSASVYATTGSVASLQCLYSLQWTAPVTGTVVVQASTSPSVNGALYAVQTYSVSIPLSGSYIFFNKDEEFSVPLLLQPSPSTQHVYSDLAPLTYTPVFTGGAVQSYTFSLRSNLGDSSDVAYLGIPSAVNFTSLPSNPSQCIPTLGVVTLTSPTSVLQCDYQLSWSTPFSSTLGVRYLAQNGTSSYDSVSIYVEFLQSSASVAIPRLHARAHRQQRHAVPCTSGYHCDRPHRRRCAGRLRPSHPRLER